MCNNLKNRNPQVHNCIGMPFILQRQSLNTGNNNVMKINRGGTSKRKEKAIMYVVNIVSNDRKQGRAWRRQGGSTL